jgi:multiple sugar transport system permease protein
MAVLQNRQPARRKPSKLQRQEARAGLLFVLPWLVGLLVFTAYPVLATVYLAFTNYSVLEPPQWIGLENFRTMFTNDPSFGVSVYNSAFYALLSVPLGLLFALLLAIVLNQRATGIGIYRTLFYLPSLVPPVAAALVFLVMFEPKGGLVNTLLRGIGLPGPAWFYDPVWAKPGLIILSLWAIGSATLIFLAGLQDVPQSLLDAAAIDGANNLQRFRHVTLPLITPVILFNLVMGVIYSFQVFAQAIVIGGTAGRPLESLLMYMVHIYRSAFRYFQMGYASALSLVLFVVVFSVTLLIFKTSQRWVFYTGDE